MKKYLLVSFVAIILTPSIALASWWNPISWFTSNEVEKPLIIVSSSTSVFSPQTETTKTISSFSWWNPFSWVKRNGEENKQKEKDEQTKSNISVPPDNQATSSDKLSEVEKLRKEVDELKKQQEHTLSVRSKDTFPPPAQTVRNPVPIENKAENFSTSLASVYLSEAKSYQGLADLADSAIQYLDDDIDKLTTLIAQYEGYKAALNGNARLLDVFISAYQLDISNTNKYKNTLVSLRDWANKNASLYKKEAVGIVSTFVTGDQFTTIVQGLQDDTIWGEGKQRVSETYNGYAVYRKEQDNYYVKGIAEASALYSMMADSNQPSTPVYQSQTVPQLPTIQIPKTTNCTLRGDGGAGIQAYVNCISY